MAELVYNPQDFHAVTFTIKIHDYEIVLKPTYDAIKTLERKVGYFSDLVVKAQQAKLGMSDIVGVYHLLQEKPTLTEEQIFQLLMRDGFMKQYAQIVDIVLGQMSDGVKAVNTTVEIGDEKK